MNFVRFDFIGGNIGFNFGRKSFTTTIGGIFTFFLVTCLSLLIIAFGRDFYKRINPSFIRQTIFPEKLPVYQINNKNFTIAARFEDDFGNLINKTNAFYLETEYISNVRNEKGDGFDAKVEILNMTQCTEDLFHDKENFESGSFDIWTCPIFDNILFGGSFASDFVSTIKINYYYCPEGGINPYTKEKCVNKDELREISKNLVYMNLGSQLPFVTPGDYDQGLKTKVLYNWYALDFKYHKLVFTYFMNYTMLTDYGWILENQVKESYLIMNKMNLDFIELQNVSPSNKLGTFWLYGDTDNGIELFKRKYVRIQQLIAEIGGLMNFLFSIGGLIIHNYNNQEYYNKLFSFYYPNVSDESSINFNVKDKINLVSILKNNTYKSIMNFPETNLDIKNLNNVSSDRQNDLLLINSLNRNIETKNINESIQNNNYSINKSINNIQFAIPHNRVISSINPNNSFENDIKNCEERVDKLKEEIMNFKNDVLPQLEFIKETKENIVKTSSVNNLFSKKISDESYNSHIEDESYNFFSILIMNICCSCSKKFSRKINFLNHLQENFLNKMDIREYLKINFDIQQLKQIFLNDKFNDLTMNKEEEKRYNEFIQKLSLNYNIN